MTTTNREPPFLHSLDDGLERHRAAPSGAGRTRMVVRSNGWLGTSLTELLPAAPIARATTLVCDRQDTGFTLTPFPRSAAVAARGQTLRVWPRFMYVPALCPRTVRGQTLRVWPRGRRSRPFSPSAAVAARGQTLRVWARFMHVPALCPRAVRGQTLRVWPRPEGLCRVCPRFCLRFTKRGGPPQGGARPAASPAYSGLIPAAFTVFCAPARSDRMRVPSASGEPPNTSTPS